MKNVLNWWYTISLPHRPAAVTPTERNQKRYAQLTASLLLLFLCAILPLLPIMLFFSTKSPSARPDAVGILFFLAIAWIAGRMGGQRFSAICIIAITFLAITGPLLTNPLTSAMVPLFGVFTISIILAGALLPPTAALITGLITCLYTGAFAFLSLNPNTYNQGDQVHYQAVNTFAIALILPIVIQIVIAVVTYIIMRNLLVSINRAERAEEIVALQTTIASYERTRALEQKQLEEGLEKIAEVHARIANGDYQARVSLNEGDVLWSVAVPLNNLLNRLQSWKSDSESLSFTQRAAEYISRLIRANRESSQARQLPLTRTPLDPVILEMNKTLAGEQQVTRTLTGEQPSRPSASRARLFRVE